jgi:hypothetical protein
MVKDAHGRQIIYEKYIAKEELSAELQLLRERNLRPVLIPSKNSLSHDFLFAAATIARTWDNARSKALVKSLNSNGDFKE